MGARLALDINLGVASTAVGWRLLLILGSETLVRGSCPHQRPIDTDVLIRDQILRFGQPDDSLEDGSRAMPASKRRSRFLLTVE